MRELKSIKLGRPFSPKITSVLTLDTLQKIVNISKTLNHSLTFVALYTFSFFSFQRLSNLLPHTTKQFDITRHMARGDILFTQAGVTVIIKWSKTIQDRKTTRTTVIPDLGRSDFCPIQALKHMLTAYPGTDNDPLFQIYSQGSLIVLTDSMARKHLKKISNILDIQPALTFHAFRRSASAWAFQHGVPLEHIQAHGTWKSDAVWSYIKTLPHATSPVTDTFRQHLHT